MSIDHRVPLAGCKCCGAKGAHEPSNWALLPPELNSRKSNLCMDCFMALLGRPCIVWGCDTLSELLSNETSAMATSARKSLKRNGEPGRDRTDDHLIKS